MKKKINDITYIIIFLVCSILFALPSIIYMLQNKTVYRFIWHRTFLLRQPIYNIEPLLNALLFFAIFSLLFLFYFLIVKNNKKIFMNKKTIFIFIAIIAILFMVIIPYTSSDVYSYIANGWSAAHYKENPYYVSIGEIVEQTRQNEQMFNKVARCWVYETVVYGPVWTLICTGLSSLSFGNIDIALFVFKLANLIVHLINCVLIYKITKKNFWVLLYGLNPFILFEALSNTHNDIFVILFILLAIYFAFKKKRLFLAVAFIAMATAMKYMAILILPFIVIYCVKEKDLKNRIKYCVLYGIEYIVIIVLFYLVYLRDFQVLAGLFMQQAKYNRSIFFLLYYFLRDKNMGIVTLLQNLTFIVFAIYYIYVVVKLLLEKDIKLYKTIQKYHIILMFFTFIVITNFNAWYIMWLFPTIMYLKPKSVNNIIHLSYASQIANLLGFALYSEDESLGVPYYIIMIILTISLNMVANKKCKLEKIKSKN